MSSIFLSYRQAEASAWAGLLQRSLEQRLPGVEIFRDIDNIPTLVKFKDHISQAVGSCDVLIAVIGPTWLNAKDETGSRKLDDEDDFVRIEIAKAIERKVPIVPALVDGASMPKRSALPEPLQELVEWQSQELTIRMWEEGCDRLAASLRILFDASAPAESATQEDPSLQVLPRQDHVDAAKDPPPIRKGTSPHRDAAKATARPGDTLARWGRMSLLPIPIAFLLGAADLLSVGLGLLIGGASLLLSVIMSFAAVRADANGRSGHEVE
jgi:hypothetical protein